MQLRNKLKEKENYILAFLFVILGAVIAAVCFDFYYDLNDDSAIKDILFGVYTGTPDGHNIQMLYGFSVLLALPYRLLRNVPWFGIFLCGCNFGCFYLIALRSLRFCKQRFAKIAMLTIEAIMITALYLWEVVFVQYTVISGLLAVTAVFLFYTTDSHVVWKQYVKQNIISILLVLISFAVRTEMLLLLFPLICLAGLFKWAEEEKILQKDNFLKYGTVLGAMLAGMLLLLVSDSMAYRSEEWKSFRSYFDERTTVYDFTGIPAYEGNEPFYEAAGIAPEQKVLLDNYNFGVDERIDSEFMGKVAEYATEKRALEKPFTTRLKDTLYLYRYRLQNETAKDYPWNLFVIIAYLLVIVIALTKRNKSYLWKLPLLIGFRSALWFFLLYRERVVDRITHPLLMMELVLLLVMVLMECDALPPILPYSCAFILAVIALAVLPESMTKVQVEYERREEVNTAYTALTEYCGEHPDNYYFFDVFSSVAYSEKMFRDVDNSLSNYDLMGGWICKSPLYDAKLAQFGLQTMETALLEENHAYILCRLDRPEADMLWLKHYFEIDGRDVEIKMVDDIRVDGKSVFGVYQLDFYGNIM